MDIFWLSIIVTIVQLDRCLSTFYPYQGNYDSKICINSTDVSCVHQLHADLLPGSCWIQSIKSSECHFMVKEVFDPFQSPFRLHVYQHKDDILNNAAINLSFPNPIWRSMIAQFKNLDYPEIQICRQFKLASHPSMISTSVFWDCLLFLVPHFENNNITLRLEDEQQHGGTYLMRMPAIRNIEYSKTSIKDWKVFFYMHQHYYESSGILVVTFLKAPFDNIAYNISSFKCADSTCSQLSLVYSQIISNETQDALIEDHYVTVGIRPWLLPGRYIIGIQIQSSDCIPECMKSFSPVYEMYRVQPLFIVGMLLIIFGTLLFIYYASISVIKIRYRRKWKEKQASPVKVLLVYHPHTKEFIEFLKYFNSVIREFGAIPLAVDEDSEGKDPNTWTKNNLCNADKVVFLLPSHLDRDSVTTVKNQWNYALKCLSGDFLKKNSDKSKFAAVKLPFSDSIIPVDDIYFLKQFSLPKKLSSLLKWIHDDSFIDHFFFVSEFAKIRKETLEKYLSQVSRSSMPQKSQGKTPSLLCEGPNSIISNHSSDQVQNYISFPLAEDQSDNEDNTKIFPHLAEYSDIYPSESEPVDSNGTSEKSYSAKDSDTEFTSESIENLIF